MANKASKRDAIRLIRSAMEAGFTREVSSMKFEGTRPWSVMVILRWSFDQGALHVWEQVIVSFRRKRRGWSVSIGSVSDYRPKTERGWWRGWYSVQRVKDMAKRLAK